MLKFDLRYFSKKFHAVACVSLQGILFCIFYNIQLFTVVYCRFYRRHIYCRHRRISEVLAGRLFRYDKSSEKF